MYEVLLVEDVIEEDFISGFVNSVLIFYGYFVLGNVIVLVVYVNYGIY